jgi:hypothetical protein
MFGKNKQPQYVKNAPKAEAFQPEITDKKPSVKKKKQTTTSIPKLGIGGFFTAILDGSFLTRKWVISMLPFIMYLVLLTIIYIGNQYSSLRRVKEIEIISNDLKELRNEHISTKSELMYQKRRSELARKLLEQGVKESNTPPVKIYVKPQVQK